MRATADLAARLAPRPATRADAAGIASIYNHYVRETTVTFETDDVSAEEMAARIEENERARLPWLVVEPEGRVVGYAHASAWKGRCAYRFSAEVTVYLEAGQGGGGIGSELYGALIAAMRERGYHALLGGIALPNDASIALHEKFGFEKIAHFREVGHKFDRWIDVGYWELLL